MARFCNKCKKTMRDEEFYYSNNKEKYPDGKLTICKACLTSRVDNWDADTYLWILEECDVPYIPKEWFNLVERYCKDPSTVTGLTIIGRYLGKMKLVQYKKHRWKDTEILQKIEEKKTEEAMQQQGYGAAEIEEVVRESRIELVEGRAPTPPAPPAPAPTQDYNNNIQDQYSPFYSADEPEDEDITGDLTEEERRYLRLKWGRSYRPEEWVRLEQLYVEMNESYDIQGAGHEDVLKLVCKTSLKANQLLDLGDRIKSMSPQTLLIAGNS